jgi:hypothetical protein
MKSKVVFLMCIIALVSSCSKDEIPANKTDDSIVRRTLTADEIVLKEKLSLTAQVVRDLILEMPEVVKEVGNLIDRKMYRDDFIYFNDLFNPEENLKLKSSGPGQTLFEKTFDELIVKKSYTAATSELKVFLVENDIALYYPYPVEDYSYENQLPSCTSDPIDNEYENIGYQLEDDGTYSEVIVDEEYSEEYPVWIIMEEEGEIALPTPVPEVTSGVHQLRVGHVMSNKQYDGIFGGGSEFKFCLLGGTITLNSATTFTSLQTCNLSRRQIRKENWVNFQYELDDDWFVSEDGTTDEGSRQFGLIEYDKNKTEFTLSFEPKLKIDKLEVSAGKAELKVVSSEGWIKLDLFKSRENFMKYNNFDMGTGIRDGYRIFCAGGVYWTLPLIKY